MSEPETVKKELNMKNDQDGGAAAAPTPIPAEASSAPPALSVDSSAVKIEAAAEPSPAPAAPATTTVSGSDDPITSPTKNDVLLGRGAKMWSHEGNRKFRDIVATYLKSYENAKLRIEKTMIVTDILKQVQEEGGRFIKLDPKSKTWKEVDKRTAIEKIGHAIRDRKALTQKKEYQKSCAQEWLAQQKRNAEVSSAAATRPDLTGIDTRFLPAESAVLLSQKTALLNQRRRLAAAGADPLALGGLGVGTAGLGVPSALAASNRLRCDLLGGTAGGLGGPGGIPPGLLGRSGLLGAGAPGMGPGMNAQGGGPPGGGAPGDSGALQHMLLVEEANRNLVTAQEALASYQNAQDAIMSLKGPGAPGPPVGQNDPAALLALRRQQQAAMQGRGDGGPMMPGNELDDGVKGPNKNQGGPTNVGGPQGPAVGKTYSL